jgi:hypothetical protein
MATDSKTNSVVISGYMQYMIESDSRLLPGELVLNYQEEDQVSTVNGWHLNIPLGKDFAYHVFIWLQQEWQLFVAVVNEKQPELPEVEVSLSEPMILQKVQELHNFLNPPTYEGDYSTESFMQYCNQISPEITTD